MNENKKTTIIIGLLGLSIIILIVLHIGVNEEIQQLYPPLTSKVNVTQINENLLVDEINEGPMNFEAAESYCKSKGMRLPTREEAWEMWRASSTCKIAMGINSNIIKDKETFLKSCHEDKTNCLVPANSVKYTCNPKANLLFLDEKSYRYGNYWLSDRYDKNGHYTANFITGMTNAYMDSIKLLGVRCVKETK